MTPEEEAAFDAMTRDCIAPDDSEEEKQIVYDVVQDIVLANDVVVIEGKLYLCLGDYAA